ncbi:Sec-independent protein translocase subunit TatA [Mobilicoccus massiliensis]|uniref:Sec-independent protein translocase subunit TatA n=1 Tax=Mobilicoccus massiliensis TaxID=1522310 RepID=UPI00058CD3D3|nr:Sec-independent protein translocase subunit TatA [Mobilicoccus massiliensis]
MPTLPGGPELIIIILVVVILFGWKKLPDAARSLGRSMRIFKAEVEEMKDKPSAASRDTVSGEARREDVQHETLRPEDHRQPPQPGATPPAGEAAAGGSPVDDAYARDHSRDENPQYRPPTA